MSLFFRLFDSMSVDTRGRFICTIVEILGGCAVVWPPLLETQEDISVAVMRFLEETTEYKTLFVQEYLLTCSRIVVSFGTPFKEFKAKLSSQTPHIVTDYLRRGTCQYWCPSTGIWWPLTKWNQTVEENILKAWWAGEIGKEYRKEPKTFSLNWRECHEGYDPKIRVIV